MTERITTLQTENECLTASCRAATANVNELKAKLAEAVGLLEKTYLWVDSPTQLSGELTDFLAKARKVMG